MHWLCGLLLFCVLLSPVSAQGDAGFSQTQLDAVFLVGDDHVRAMYSFSYIRPESMGEFRWLFPIPADATHIELGAAYLPAILQYQTDPNIEPPDQPCTLAPTLVYGHGLWPYVSYFVPDNAQLTQLESFEEALAWLDDSPQDTAMLEDYEHFVGVTIQPQAEGVANQPDDWMDIRVNMSPLLVVDYAGTDIFLPLGIQPDAIRTELDNYSASGTMPVTTYIFAEKAYTSANYTSVAVDLNEIGSGRNEIAAIMRSLDGTPIFYNELDPLYYYLMRRNVQAVDGMGMVVEYQQMPDWSLHQNTRESYPEASAVMDSLLADYPMLTRTRTFISQDSTLPDPQFIPAPQTEPGRLDLRTTADPAWFYGCTTRTLYNPELEARLPDGRTYIDALDMQVAHPADWSLSQLDDDTFALAPEQVTLERR